MSESPLNIVLYLGDVDFQAFEIPESISAGGTQTLVEHKYPGGIRTLDSMGPDDADITWTGIFTGPYAELRCKQIDRMRRQGLPQPLSFAMESWIVKIRSFTWQFKRVDQIDYSIALCVITDETQNPPEGDESPDDLYIEDFAAAQADAQEMANAQLVQALNIIDIERATVNALSSGSVAFLAGMASSLAVAAGVSAAAVQTLDSAVSVGLTVSQAAQDPALMAASLINFVGSAGALPLALDASARIGRMQDTIAGIGA